MAVKNTTVDLGTVSIGHSGAVRDQVKSLLRGGGYTYRKHFNKMELVGITTYKWHIKSSISTPTGSIKIEFDEILRAYDYIYPIEKNRVRAVYVTKYVDDAAYIEDDADYLLGGAKSVLGA